MALALRDRASLGGAPLAFHWTSLVVRNVVFSAGFDGRLPAWCATGSGSGSAGNVSSRNLPTSPAAAAGAAPRIARWNRNDVATLVAGRLAGVARASALLALATDAERAAIDDAATRELRQGARVARQAAELHDVLATVDIPSLGISGVASADLHPRHAARRFEAVELLVAPERFADAVHAFERAGLQRAPGDGWGERALRMVPDSVALNDGGAGSVVVSRASAPWSLTNRVAFADLQRRSRVASVGGRTLRVTGVADTLLLTSLRVLSCWGAADAPLWPWRDLLVLANVADPAVVAAIAASCSLGWALHDVLGAIPVPARPDRLLAAAPHDLGARDRARRAALLAAAQHPPRHLAPVRSLPPTRALARLGWEAWHAVAAG